MELAHPMGNILPFYPKVLATVYLPFRPSEALVGLGCNFKLN